MSSVLDHFSVIDLSLITDYKPLRERNNCIVASMEVWSEVSISPLTRDLLSTGAEKSSFRACNAEDHTQDSDSIIRFTPRSRGLTGGQQTLSR